jgi:hypothetical protein
LLLKIKDLLFVTNVQELSEDNSAWLFTVFKHKGIDNLKLTEANESVLFLVLLPKSHNHEF